MLTVFHYLKKCANNFDYVRHFSVKINFHGIIFSVEILSKYIKTFSRRRTKNFCYRNFGSKLCERHASPEL